MARPGPASSPASQRGPARPPDGNGRAPSFPSRPLLTTPPELRHRDFIRLERQRLAAQPRLGLAGLLFAAVVFFALVLGTGHVESSLLVLGPLATFALPAVAMVAFWWNDWPGARLSTPWSGLLDTALVIAAAVVLTMAGQAIVERLELRGIFSAQPAPGIPTTFPATLPLAGAAFAATLQLSLVCEGWPLRGLGRLRSGLAALAVSWAVAIAAYFLVVNVDAVPAAERAAAGLRNPGGPIAAPDFGAALIAVGVWQAVIYIAWRGWPVAGLAQRARRLLCGNAIVLGGGVLTYLILRDAAGQSPGAISAACGCVITAVLIAAMLFEGWPASRLDPGPGRVLTLGLIALVALALDRSLAAYADSVPWVKASPDDWVTTAALSFIGAGIILHVGIGLRWPLAQSGERRLMTLDEVIPSPRQRMCHSRTVRGAPAVVWNELLQVTMSALPLGLALEGARLLPARLAGRGHEPLAARTFLDVTPIPVLYAKPPHVVISAGLSQAWRLLGGLTPPNLNAADLRAWPEPGWIKVAMEFRLQSAPLGTRLSTETRVVATDPTTSRAFAAYWLVIRAGSGAIRREVLRAVARRAESSAHSNIAADHRRVP